MFTNMKEIYKIHSLYTKTVEYFGF